jgi:hypothetical protein
MIMEHMGSQGAKEKESTSLVMGLTKEQVKMYINFFPLVF